MNRASGIHRAVTKEATVLSREFQKRLKKIGVMEYLK